MSRQIERVREIFAAVGQSLTTAEDLAERLNCSQRTIYRDVELMKAAGSPIEGAAGVGYILRSGRAAS